MFSGVSCIDTKLTRAYIPETDVCLFPEAAGRAVSRLYAIETSCFSVGT